jgi:hypothetical protein
MVRASATCNIVNACVSVVASACCVSAKHARLSRRQRCSTVERRSHGQTTAQPSAALNGPYRTESVLVGPHPKCLHPSTRGFAVHCPSTPPRLSNATALSNVLMRIDADDCIHTRLLLQVSCPDRQARLVRTDADAPFKPSRSGGSGGHNSSATSVITCERQSAIKASGVLFTDRPQAGAGFAVSNLLY